jgi:hypothetical protein
MLVAAEFKVAAWGTLAASDANCWKKQPGFATHLKRQNEHKKS